MKTIIIISFFILQDLSAVGQDFWEEVILPDSVENIFSMNFNSQEQAFICSEKGIYRSDDDGLNWEFMAGFISSSIEVSKIDEIYLGVDAQNRILYSNSNGQEWDTIQTNFELGGRIALINDSLLFAFDWGWISKSMDGGYTWNTVLSTGNTEIFNDIIENQGIVFSGSTAFLDPLSGGINNSLDLGNSWQQISLQGYGVSSFALDMDRNLLCGVRFQYYGQEYGVFRSVDNGLNWNNILSGYIVTSLAVDVNGGIYAGCDSDFGPEGVQYSSDNGLSWESINSGLHENASITSLAISPNGYIYATTIFPSKLYRSINPVVFINEPVSSASMLRLFPNPCNNVINIKFGSNYSSDQNYYLEFVNSKGEIVFAKSFYDNGNGIISCNISYLKQGLYFVNIYSNLKLHQGRFVKL